MILLSDCDFNLNKAKNFVVEKITKPFSTTAEEEGRIIYDQQRLYYSDGVKFRELATTDRVEIIENPITAFDFQILQTGSIHVLNKSIEVARRVYTSFMTHYEVMFTVELQAATPSVLDGFDLLGVVRPDEALDQLYPVGEALVQASNLVAARVYVLYDTSPMYWWVQVLDVAAKSLNISFAANQIVTVSCRASFQYIVA